MAIDETKTRYPGCEICGQWDAYAVTRRASDNRLECVDCWLKRENAADLRRETRERNEREGQP